ncbi:MAG: TonB family protein [Bacteroidales bacterium]|nr:TonB family protein [Bacteroidales bacterium]
MFLVLILVSFSVPPPPQNEEGILVNFGTDETGLGMIEPSPPAVQEVASPPPASNAAKKSDEEPLLTQNTEEAPEVKKVDPEAEKKRIEKIEADKKLRAAREAERIRKKQEDDERKRVEAEQQRQADIMNRTKNALANSKNAGTSSTSEGIAGGTGNQGDPRGSVDSNVRGEGGGLGDKGISYELKGRGFQNLPKPIYEYQGEGRVVVEVTVDRSGKVTQAVPGIKGSSTLDEYLLKVAKDAAMKASFEAKPDAPLFQKGTITYNFILK